MKFVFLNHQDKGAAYLRELSLKHEYVPWDGGQPPAVDFVFTDSDIRRRRGQLEALREAGARRFFVYPHTARPNLVNDIEPAWEHTTAQFVTTRAHREILIRYGYPRPVHAVGWGLCELQGFQERNYLRNVLFAPIHHRCAEIDQLANRDAYARLAVLAKAGHFHLTVRHYMGVETTGIKKERHERIHWVRVDDQRPDWADIERVDCVVGHQTFLYLAVARGIPAVGFGTWVPSHIVPGNEVIYAPNWNEYVRDMAFPLDIAFGDPLDALWGAVERDKRVDKWRERMIGEPFNGTEMIKELETYL